MELNIDELNLDSLNIEALFLDLDDTLYNYKECHKFAIQKVFLKESFGYDETTFKKVYRDARTYITNKLTPSGTCRSRYLAFLKMAEEKKVKNAFLISRELEQHYWSSLIENITPFDYVNPLIEWAKQRKIKIVIISDMTTDIQIQKIIKLNLHYKIDFLVTSEDVGKEKPSLDIFNEALSKVECPPSKSLMIGDSYEKDILGAKALGIQTFHLQEIEK